MRILFLGDVVGRQGRSAVSSTLADLRRRFELDVIIANAENASGGLGLSPENAVDMHGAGIDVITTGNHVWKHRAIFQFLDKTNWIIRPANFPQGAPGSGVCVVEKTGRPVLSVINLMGRTYMEPIDCPFRTADEILKKMPPGGIVLVDFHAEATSEKKAMGYYLNGRVSAVIGTHTHVQTNDPTILSKGTAYLTDAGMCGPMDSVLGMEPEIIIRRFITALPERFELAAGRTTLQGVILEIDDATGKATSIELYQQHTAL